MFGFHWADIAVLFAYLVGTTAIGVWLATRVHGMGDFFMPRRFGKIMLIMHSFGTGTHSDQAVIVASKSFTSGLSGIWYQWQWLFVTPFYWLVAAVLRRTRAITIADMVAFRYNTSVSLLYTCIACAHLVVAMGVILKGSGAVISAASDNFIRADVAIAGMTVLFVLYGASGGLAAAIVTDFIQGLLTVFFSFLLLPYVLDAVGGMEGLREKIADPAMFSLVAPGDISVFYVTIIALNALVGSIVMPNMMGVCGSSKTELDSRFGLMGGNFVKRICTMAWCLTGLAAVAYFAGRDVHPDRIFGMMAHEFLPAIAPGLLGLFMAAMVATVMSTCDSLMINCSALLTENVYKQARPNCSERHYVWFGRFAGGFVVVAGLILAYQFDDVVAGIETLWKIIPMMGVVFWLGFFWRGATVAGAWAGPLAGFAAWAATTHEPWLRAVAQWPANTTWGFVEVTSATAGGVEGAVYQMSLPWQMVCCLSAALVVGVVVSRFTRPVNEDKLNRFYELVRTPVVPGEVILRPCHLPEGREPAPRRNLFPSESFEVPVPTRTAVVGFLVGWVIVGAMIGGFYWLTRS